MEVVVAKTKKDETEKRRGYEKGFEDGERSFCNFLLRCLKNRDSIETAFMAGRGAVKLDAE
jgi:hypothetical protein